MNFSKSKYCGFCQCEKIAWLEKYKPDVKTVTEYDKLTMLEGNEVGDFARGLFGDFVDVTVLKKDGAPDLTAMIEKTKEELKNGTENICEASFSYKGCYCAVDILRKENGGYAIYEVKSVKTPNFEKENKYYLQDISYQKYVLEKCGIKVVGTYLVHLNGAFVKHGEIDKKELFKIVDVAELIKQYFGEVEDKLKKAEIVLAETEEPKCDFSKKCRTPHDCQFFKYCIKGFETPIVFDLRGNSPSFEKKCELFKAGKKSFKDLLDCDNLGEKAKQQIEFELNDRGIYVDKDAIRSFLDKVTFPLYFLDYETISYAIPQFDGTSPQQKMPFQFSVQCIEKEGEEPHAEDFLGTPEEDPRLKLARSLLKYIPIDKNPCILIYNSATEPDVTRKLADTPGLTKEESDNLRKLADSMLDLMPIFRGRQYYRKEFHGGYSLKDILPALFPDHATLSYAKLSDIHDGCDAMAAYKGLRGKTGKELEKTRKDLIDYCRLDTTTALKIWEELVRVSK